MKNLNELTVKELQAIAKKNGISQSRTVDGKRSRLTEMELIKAIEANQAESVTEVNTVEVVPATVETVQTVDSEVLNTFINSVVSKSEQVKMLAEKATQGEKELTVLSLSEVVPFAKSKLKEITCLVELHKFKTKLLASFNDKQQTRKRTLKAKWAMQYKLLLGMFAQTERKLKTS